VRILLAEDDALLGDGIRGSLRQQGFRVDWVRDGAAARHEIASGAYEAIVLDLGLPLVDGMQVLRSMRAQAIGTPVLVLTARDAVPDRIRGLETGADDYLVKPVDLLELGARLRALVRRAHGKVSDVLHIGDLELHTAERRVLLGGNPVTLSTREFDLLHALMLSAGRVLTREHLEQNLYSWGQEVESNAIEFHIHNLRRKLRPALIRTVRGVGYLLPRPDTSEGTR